MFSCSGWVLNNWGTDKNCNWKSPPGVENCSNLSYLHSQFCFEPTDKDCLCCYKRKNGGGDLKSSQEKENNDYNIIILILS